MELLTNARIRRIIKASLPTSAQSGIKRVVQFVWRGRIMKFRRAHTTIPAPLTSCIKWQKDACAVMGSSKALIPDTVRQKKSYKGETLKNARVAERFREVTFSGASPPAETIDWLVEFVYQRRPRRVLEFGSGLTTVILCFILEQIHGKDGFRLLSLDQDQKWAAETKVRLAAFDGNGSCRVVHVPVIPSVVAGQGTSVYDVNAIGNADLEWLGRAEFVWIDGPYCEGPGRYGTLHGLRKSLSPGAQFAMDDALRQKELIAGAEWVKEGIIVDGVLSLGWGIMIGRVP